MAKFGVSLGVLLLALGSTRLYAVDIAVLDSDINTKSFFLEAYPTAGENEYARYWMGWKYVLKCDTSHSYIILKDFQITASNLATVKILILGNTIRLHEDQVKAIDTWVRGGGRLIATFGSGYQGFATSLNDTTLLKGKTFGLHQLWHDPMSKVFGTDLIGAYVTWVLITSSSGPTSGFPVNTVLPYGMAGQLLTNTRDSLGYLLLSIDWDRAQPAVLSTKASKGLVVYISFSPEYIVSQEFVQWNGHPSWGSGEPFTCGTVVDSFPFPEDRGLQAIYPPGGSSGLRKLMKGAIDYLRTTP